MRDTLAEAHEVFAALEQVGRQILFLYPNADAGSRRLIRMAEHFVANHPRAKLLVNFDHNTYLSLLRCVALLVGNSSSGIIESTSLGIPTLNIGVRQRGREHAANVLDVAADRRQIRAAIAQALSPKFRDSVQGLENPYGDGHAAQTIVEVLTRTPLGARLLFKT
jgi:UDP-N-acetylglucosamine 2-epimerase (non-hydrolysing)/GDP/UDP-N,N'-diacetylbacillosamine 2-epimerase (hydrolysing)